MSWSFPPALVRAPAVRAWLLASMLAFAVFVLTRFSLLILSREVLLPTGPAVLKALLKGALRDLAVAACIALPFLLESGLPRRWQAGPFFRRLRFFLFFLFVFTLLFVAVAEGIFWDEFGARFNFIALDYLVFTTEVIGNVRESYPVGGIVAGLLLATLATLFFLRRRLLAISPPGAEGSAGRKGRLGAFVLLALLVGAAGTGFVRLKPPEFSDNAYLNELADNGWRSFVWAARQNRLDYRQFYATRPDAEVLATLERIVGHPVSVPTAAAPATGGVLPAHLEAKEGALAGAAKRPNVVVVMMESMSADFMDTFGSNSHLTPNLDRLAREGVLFSRLYASGTRTVRGLEALSAALPPLPGKSIVRWPDADGLRTLGGSFARHGWSPYFIYGGYGMFDNMNAYFSGNGYRVVDRPEFPEGVERFANVWGVADEHLFDEVLATLDRGHAQGRPVFAHVMTTSNHVPFTYPDGRIDIPSPGGRRGAIKYSDHAIGRFVEMAKGKPWFDDTIFLFVADHCARSAGKTRIPVPRYHIPAIVYAPKIVSAARIDTLSSQIDLAPTLLTLAGLGREEAGNYLGRDIFTMKPEEGRAFLSTYQTLGYLKNGMLTVLSPRRRIETFRVDPDKDEAVPVETDETASREALAWFQGAAVLMERHVAGRPRPEQP